MSAHQRALDAHPENLSPRDALALLARLAGASTPAPAVAIAGGGVDALRQALTALIAGILKLSPDEVRPERPLIELGLDSISATDLMSRFNEEHELAIPSTILFEFDNLADLSAHLWETHRPALATRYGPAKSGPALVTPPRHGSDASPPPAARPQTRQAPLAAAPAAAPARRIDVKTMWAEIEARLPDMAAAAAPPALADRETWSACASALARLLPQAHCVAVPDRAAALTLLGAAGGEAGGEAGSRCVWLGGVAADGLRSIDPRGEEALEDLLEAQGSDLIVCLSASEAGGGFPSHLLRALERMRDRKRGFLAVFADHPRAGDGHALRGLAFDALVVGATPMMAVALAPALAERVGAARLERFQGAYRNDWSAAALLRSLKHLNEDATS